MLPLVCSTWKYLLALGSHTDFSSDVLHSTAQILVPHPRGSIEKRWGVSFYSVYRPPCYSSFLHTSNRPPQPCLTLVYCVENLVLLISRTFSLFLTSLPPNSTLLALRPFPDHHVSLTAIFVSFLRPQNIFLTRWISTHLRSSSFPSHSKIVRSLITSSPAVMGIMHPALPFRGQSLQRLFQSFSLHLCMFFARRLPLLFLSSGTFSNSFSDSSQDSAPEKNKDSPSTTLLLENQTSRLFVFGLPYTRSSSEWKEWVEYSSLLTLELTDTLLATSLR